MAVNRDSYIRENITGPARQKGFDRTVRKFVGGANRRILQGQNRPRLQNYGSPAISGRTANIVGRTVGFPVRRQGYQGRKGYSSRGRPRGSYKYFIPGRGPVDVFTWRKYMSRMRGLQRQQYNQQFSRQRRVNPYNQFQQTPQFPMEQQYPQNIQPEQEIKFPQPNDGEGMIGTKIIDPEYNPYPKEMHFFHSFNPLGIDKGSVPAPEQYFYETDIFSGEKKLRKKGELV